MRSGTASVRPPTGIAAFLERAIGLYRATPLLFLGLTILPYTVLAVIGIALDRAVGATALFTTVRTMFLDPTAIGSLPALSADEIRRLAIYGAALGAAGVIVLSVQAAALVDAMARRSRGEPVTVAAALRVGLRAGPRLILAGLVAFVAFTLVVIVAETIFTIVTVATGSRLPTLLGAIAFIALTGLVLAAWTPLPAVVLLEPSGPLVALRRTWSLSSGSLWRNLGLVAVLSVLGAAVGLVVGSVIGGPFVPDGLLRMVLQAIASVAANALWAPVQWGAVTLLYDDLRARTDAH